MAADRDVPPTGEGVLAGGPLLQQDAAVAVRDDGMDGAMEQAGLVNLAACGESGLAVVPIDDGEQLAVGLRTGVVVGVLFGHVRGASPRKMAAAL
jgi:hypothetical protein